jgi:Subtilase family
MLIRMLVAAALCGASYDAHAQNRLGCGGGGEGESQIQCRVGGPVPPPPGHSNNGTIIGISTAIGVIVIAGIWAYLTQQSPPAQNSAPPPQSYPPSGVAPTQLSIAAHGPGGGGGGGGGGGAGVGAGAGGGGGGGGGGGAGPGGGTPAATRPTALRAGCNPAPPGETRFDTTHVLFDIPATVPATTLDAIAARHAMTQQEMTTVRLTGRTLHVWRIDNGASVDDVIRDVCTNPADRQIAGAQPNYLYELAQPTVSGQAQQEPVNSAQYAPDKLKLVDAHRLASGNKVLVAIIDSEVDRAHPDLAGAITASFNAASAAEPAHTHGTGMAGAIAAHRTMLGTAPRVGLLTVRAFSATANSAEGTTFNILKGLDWAADQGARVVNMSFAGPADPRLRDALQKANNRGMVLIAAAGNAGPTSPPLYPAADPGVIGVTATDSRDAVFSGANRGNYIAVAAPGVDVFAPAPNGAYQLSTGTSIAAAEVSGVVALMIERNPALTPAAVRRILMDTATRLGPKGGRDFGAGLVNAYEAVRAAKPNIGQ